MHFGDSRDRSRLHVLDIGGPRGLSFMAQLKKWAACVLAVDESERFVTHIHRSARERDMMHLEAAIGDVQRLETVSQATPASFDMAYARWVLCFTPRPDHVVRGAAALLKPGGCLCVHDYFNYETMTAAPRRASYARIVKATAQSWRDNGGDPDVMSRLPAILHDAGFELEHLTVHQRLARPGDTMWYWTSTWWSTYAPKLADMGYVTRQEVDELHADLESMKRSHDFLVLPPVYELMARKR